MTEQFRKRKADKPVGYSGVAPYYREVYARELVPFLERLEKDPTKRIKFSCIELGLRPKTLHSKIDQAWLWLTEKDEHKSRWRELRLKYQIVTEVNHVIIRRATKSRSLAMGGTVEEDESVRDKEARRNWKKTLLDYIEESVDMECKALEIADLRISPADFEWLVTYLGNISSVVATLKLTETGFKIIKNSEIARRMEQMGAES